MADKPKYETREQWLLAAVALMTPLFESKEYKVPKIRVACGWPSARGLSKKKRTIGQCWANEADEHKLNQIFISPWLSKVDEKCGVLDTLVHEVVHAVVGIKEGHNKVFGKCARAVGLEGKLTSTCANNELLETIKGWAAKLGPYPHGKLDGLKSPVAKQSTRLIKCECASGDCEYNVRITRKWLEELGAPICPAKGHGPMKYIIPKGMDFDPDDEGGGDE